MPTDHPKDSHGNPVNLFCSGHTFLSDGRLLVVGGHLADGDGLNQASLYTAAPADDSGPGTWTPTAPMGTGNDFRRWYPTAITFPNGTVLVLSGSYKPSKFADQIVVRFLQVWDNGAWKPIRMGNGDPLGFDGLPLYPRRHRQVI